VKYTVIKINLYLMVHSIVLKFIKIWLSHTLNIIRVMMFNATFNDISVISRRSVLLVEETRGSRENH